MRKIFAGATLFSVVGATVLGGALAWSNTQITDTQNITVGAIDFAITDYDQVPGALLGPDDGINNLVGIGVVENTGNLNLTYDGNHSGVKILNVSGAAQVGTATCNATNFGGAILEYHNQAEPNLDAGEEGAFSVGMNVAVGAPDACQGATVSYIVYITMQTTASN